MSSCHFKLELAVEDLIIMFRAMDTRRKVIRLPSTEAKVEKRQQKFIELFGLDSDTDSDLEDV